MFNHKDTLRAPTWQLHLSGHKLWHLCPPSQDEILEKAGKHDFFDPNYEETPELLGELGLQGCSQAVAEAGDLVYYPEDYWHQTLNLHTPTVSIGSTMLTAASYRILYDELLHECSGSADGATDTSSTDTTSMDRGDAEEMIGQDCESEPSSMSTSTSTAEDPNTCSPEDTLCAAAGAPAADSDTSGIEKVEKLSFRVFPPHKGICATLPTCLRDWQAIFD